MGTTNGTPSAAFGFCSKFNTTRTVRQGEWRLSSLSSDMTDIHELCNRGEWGAVLRRLRENPGLALGDLVLPDGAVTTILHRAIVDLESSVGAFCVADFVLSRRDVAREAASRVDGHGRLPMHVLVEPRTTRGGRKGRVLELLAAAFPQALLYVTPDVGRTPLHVASTYGWDDLHFFSKLVAADPSACFVEDSNGYLPAHLVCKHSKCLDKVKALLTIHPLAIHAVTSDFSTMLTLAWSSDAGPNNPQLIDFLVEASSCSVVSIADTRSSGQSAAKAVRSDPTGSQAETSGSGVATTTERRPTLMAEAQCQTEFSNATTPHQPIKTPWLSEDDDNTMPEASLPGFQLGPSCQAEVPTQQSAMRQVSVSPATIVDGTHGRLDGRTSSQAHSSQAHSVKSVEKENHDPVNVAAGTPTVKSNDSMRATVSGSRRLFMDMSHEPMALGVASKKLRLDSSTACTTSKVQSKEASSIDATVKPPNQPFVGGSPLDAVVKVSIRGLLRQSPISVSDPSSVHFGLRRPRSPSRDKFRAHESSSATTTDPPLVIQLPFVSQDRDSRNPPASLVVSSLDSEDPAEESGLAHPVNDSAFDGAGLAVHTRDGVDSGRHHRKKRGFFRAVKALVAALSLVMALALGWIHLGLLADRSLPKDNNWTVPATTTTTTTTTAAATKSSLGDDPTKSDGAVEASWILDVEGCNATQSAYQASVSLMTASGTETFLVFGPCLRSIPRQSPAEEFGLDARSAAVVTHHDEPSQPSEAYTTFVWTEIKSHCASILHLLPSILASASGRAPRFPEV